MATRLAIVFSLFAAMTLRHGGDFAEPDYSESEAIDDLERLGPPKLSRRKKAAHASSLR